MSKQQQPSSQPQAEPRTEEIAEITDGERRSRTMQLARRHPVLTVAGVATVGLVGGIELAAGVLLGAGVAALVRGRNPRAQAQTQMQVAPQGTETPQETEPEAIDRARDYIDRMTPVIRKRWKAVVQAMRGEIEPANP